MKKAWYYGFFGERGYEEKGGMVRDKCTFFDGGWMRGSSGWGGFGHGDGSSFELDEKPQ